jgi:hypothetical protein
MALGSFLPGVSILSVEALNELLESGVFAASHFLLRVIALLDQVFTYNASAIGIKMTSVIRKSRYGLIVQLHEQ